MPKILTGRERWIVRGLFIVILLASLGLVVSFYVRNTQAYPTVGGQYTEGVLGQPRYINPVLSQTNDADRDLSRLVYSSLFKYSHTGELVKDLAKEYQVKDEGLTYEIKIKENIKWHDGEPLTAKDIAFTVKTIQDPQYNSPLKQNWQGVKIEQPDDYTIVFKLNNVYAPFLNNLTFGVLPQHLWGGISAQNFSLAEYNLKPIGSGPYQFEAFEKDKSGKIKSISFIKNNDFYLPSPYQVKTENSESETLYGPFLNKITFKFYQDQKSLIEAYNPKEVEGLSFIENSNLENVDNRFALYEINLPEYYALFFNQTNSKVLANDNIRKALSYATDKSEIINEAVGEKAESINSPLLPGWPAYKEDLKNHEYKPEEARKLLEEEGWIDENQDGIREKEVSLENNTTTVNNLRTSILTTKWPTLERVANIIKSQWEEVGVEVNVQTKSSNDLQANFIKERNYEILLFGEVLGAEPDPFAFWHSSQIKDPGLNLALYQNKETDKLLEEARQTLDKEERFQKYEEFQEKLVKEVPAIFLYSPDYLYPIKKEIKGVLVERIPEPSYRFSQIENWYIKTKREWK